jgi:hypothetical protein
MTGLGGCTRRSSPPVDHHPRTPPKSGGSEAPPGFRATSFHLLGLVLGLLVMACFAPILAPALSIATLVLSLGLTCLVCYFPLRQLARLEDLVVPLWWDLFYFASVAGFLWAALVGDPEGMLVMGMPTIVLNVLLCVAVWLIEYRNRVRIYTTGRRYAFVPRSVGPARTAIKEPE